MDIILSFLEASGQTWYHTDAYHLSALGRLTSKHKYLASNIIAMDETAVWADMVANTTVDDIGTRSVSLKTTGHEKLGCPCVFLQRQMVKSLNR